MEERMQILNLLEEGKVNVDEAVKLLEALGGACCEPADDDDKAEESEPAKKTKGSK